MPERLPVYKIQQRRVVDTRADLRFNESMARNKRSQALANLVLDVYESSGMSYRELAERAWERGYDISHSQLQAYATGKVRKPPSRAQVDALAAALDLTIRNVLEAALLEFYGVDVDLPPDNRGSPAVNLSKPKTRRRRLSIRSGTTA